jgi:hypothetical protein
VARRHCGHTGRTTSRRQTHSSGWWTRRTGSDWQIADKSWMVCSCRRYVTQLGKDIIAAAKMSQRLMGASLLVFKNKSDVAGSMTEAEIREVCLWHFAMSGARRNGRPQHTNHRETGITPRQHPYTQVADHDMQRDDGRESSRRATMGRPGRQRPPFPILDHSTISVVATSIPTTAEKRRLRRVHRTHENPQTWRT